MCINQLLFEENLEINILYPIISLIQFSLFFVGMSYMFVSYTVVVCIPAFLSKIPVHVVRVVCQTVVNQLSMHQS